MTARVVLSFDCEGKWGVADNLTAKTHEALDDASLRRTYRAMLDSFAAYHIPATFAFVGCFTLPMERLVQIRPELERHANIFPGYLSPAVRDCFDGSRQGWSAQWAMEAVACAREKHEIGLHGITHVHWDDPAMTEDLAREELGLAYDNAFPVCAFAHTYVYPCNAIAYANLLAERGLCAYRGKRLHRSRLSSFISEFDIFSKSDIDGDPSGLPLEIPAGTYINWQHGLRRVVPFAVSFLRMRNILAHAVSSGGVAHFWGHPEDFATAPSTFVLLNALLKEIASLRDRGLCEILTQQAYALRKNNAPESQRAAEEKTGCG